MLSSWDIHYWPTLGFNVFLPHCAEDRESLVLPVYDELCRWNIIPSVDRHDWPVGYDSFAALRKKLLESRHAIYFVTPALLRHGREWCAVERAYSELIQRQFQYQSLDLWNDELPLIFAKPDSLGLLKSTYDPVRTRARYCNIPPRQCHRRVRWCVEQIASLIEEQRSQTQALSSRLNEDSNLCGSLSQSPGLLARLRSLDPIPVA